MRYELIIERVFTATHALRLYDGTLEEPHAHDWRVVVTIGSDELDEIDVVVDFHSLERWLDEVIEPMRGVDLNEQPWFAARNPSAERVAKHISDELEPRLPEPVSLLGVAVTEAPGCVAVYRPND